MTRLVSSWRTLAVFSVVGLGLLGCPGALPPLKVATTSPGEVKGASASAAIGAAGGSVVSGDGRLKVTIPAGALAASTTVSVQPITGTAPGAVGLAYRLGPEGTTFSAPVELRFALGAVDLAGTVPGKLDVATQLADGRWQVPAHATWDAAASTLTTTATHFSDWSPVSGAVLTPTSATVKPGEKKDFTISICEQVISGDLTSLLAECSNELGYLGTGLAWQVNGVDNGDSTVGTIAPGGSTGTYAAPARAPKPNTVAVSATITEKKGGKVILISQVRVSVAQSLGGSISLSRQGQLGTSGPPDVNVSGLVLDPDPNNCNPSTKCSYLGTGNFLVLDDTDVGTNLRCHTAQKTGTVQVGLVQGYVDMPGLFSLANQYGFTNGADAVVSAVTCDDKNGGPSVTQDVTVLAPATLTNLNCNQEYVDTFTDPVNLTGTDVYSCSSSVAWTVSWALTGI